MTLQDTLLLLRLVEALTRMGPRLCALQSAPGAPALISVTSAVVREEFVNSKMASKLSRQLQDVLTLCSGGLPLWCRQLTLAYPFLFPFDTRRQYFYCTAFGLSRALQRLQSQQQAGGGAHNDARNHDTRELRVGRLQRQKVPITLIQRPTAYFYFIWFTFIPAPPVTDCSRVRGQ